MSDKPLFTAARRPRRTANGVCSDESTDLLTRVNAEPVGIVSLSSVDRWADNAELGYVVLPLPGERRYATEASRLPIAHAFAQTGPARGMTGINRIGTPRSDL